MDVELPHGQGPPTRETYEPPKATFVPLKVEERLMCCAKASDHHYYGHHNGCSLGARSSQHPPRFRGVQ